MALLRTGICPALTNEVKALLKEHGIRTVTDFITKDLEELSKLISLPYGSLAGIRRVLLAQYSDLPELGFNLYNKFCNSATVLPSGHASLNQLLDGGLYTGEVIEIIGEASSGKTQLCFSSAAALIRETGYNVIYIDSSAAFSGQRLSALLGDDNDLLQHQLSRIKCIPVLDIFDVFEVIAEIQNQILIKADGFFQYLKLVILDSVFAVAYPLIGAQQADGYSYLAQIGQKLKVLAVENFLAVLVVNNLSFGDDGGKVASLGRSWSHMPHTRLMLEKSAGASCKVYLMKSIRMATGCFSWINIDGSSLESA